MSTSGKSNSSKGSIEIREVTASYSWAQKQPTTNRMTLPWYWGLGTVIRICLFYAVPAASVYWSERVHVITPFNSFKRVEEGLYLYKHGIDPFDGGVYHQSPLLLGLFSSLPEICFFPLFILLDLAIAFLLFRIAQTATSRTEIWPKAQYYRDEESEAPEKESDAKEIPESLASDIKFMDLCPTAIGGFYLLHPFAIVSCIAQSTTQFSSLFILLAIYAALKEKHGLSMFSLAVASSLTQYPFALLPPCILLARKGNFSLRTIVNDVTIFMIYIVGVQLISFQIAGGSWAFLDATHGARLRIQDLTPNVGLFWYFFTEIFDNFRAFFLGVFQMLLYVFVVPLSIVLRADPLFLAYILAGIVSVFNSYPSVSDTILYLSLFMLQSSLFPFMRHSFLVVNLLCYASILGPLFFDLWIYAGSGNANFFYAITLVFGLCQVFLLLDSLYAWIKRDWERWHPGWTLFRVEVGQ